MTPLIMAELVSAIYVIVSLISQYQEHDNSLSTERLKLCSLITLAWLVSDALSYVLKGPVCPAVILYLVNFLAYTLGNVLLIAFMIYGYTYIKERGRINPWVVRVPMIVMTANVLAVAVLFCLGKLVRVENGVLADVGGIPLPMSLVHILVLIWLPVVAFTKRKSIGDKEALLLGLFIVAPVVGVIVLITTGQDYSAVFGALALMIIVMLLQKKSIHMRLKSAREAAEAANRAKTDFLSSMSHDIRTPMNAIIGFTAIAKKHTGDRGKVEEYLDKIDISGQQLLALINQVLEMARIESGKIEFNEKPVNIRERFDSMTTTLSEQAKFNGLNFRSELKDITHWNVIADDARMSSITINITGNAMKYTPGGGNVDFTLRETEPRKEGYATYVFTVADTGIGMSEEYLSKLFEPFSREKSSTVSRIQGSGLGMSIVKNLVDVLGGNIDVTSELGKGTTVNITLDFKIDTDARTQPDETAAPRTAVSFEGRRVLLVEDNDMNREIASDILSEKGLKVEEAEDGDIAVAKVEEAFGRGDYSYYDFILMDIQMPRMNGYDATVKIRELPVPGGVHVPIIAMTANAFEEDRQHALSVGMDEHLSKPIDSQKLLGTIARFL